MTGGVVMSDGTLFAGVPIYDLPPEGWAEALRSEIARCDAALIGNSEAPRKGWELQRAAAVRLLEAVPLEGALL